ncbi:tryptophan aminotransferase-related protein 3 [Canna indica]|uniref:Tryptophan aminotransferase-related protein 3 n=1 Tax=Canna indica TaxID=4628 RepID=A0AAQ3K270_9LILI|nr:tryptophan aminotransferase-related protein 3 [Canna indica]
MNNNGCRTGGGGGGGGKPNLATPLLLLCLFSSLALNSYFCSSHLHLSRRRPLPAASGWARSAAAEAEAVAAIDCSGHGRAFLDSERAGGVPVCECNGCYSGSDCSQLLLDCPADLDSGDPLFLEVYWQEHAASSAVVFSGWHRMSYITNGQSNSFISDELDKNIRLLHQVVGNAIVDDKLIILGAGSSQLINALVYALSSSSSNANSSSPALVVASIPYYPFYKAQTTLFQTRHYAWEGDASNLVNSSADNIIEFVTSPNNPDGQMKHSVVRGAAVIYDHAYYWPHFAAIQAPADGDVMLFTNSKVSGHAGSRFGWALIKDEQVYLRAIEYMQLNTMGTSHDTQLRILKLIKVMIAEQGGEKDIFEFGYNTLKARWSRLSNLISSSNRFSLQQLSPQYCNYFKKIRDPSPAYAWLKCEREEDEDCNKVLENAGIISRGGALFEAGSHYTRISLIKNQDYFELFMKRMEALVSNSSSSAASA